MKINISKSAGDIFLFFSLIPWVNFGLNNSDSQPWAFSCAIFYILFMGRGLTLPKYSLKILVLIIFGIIISILFSHDPDDFLVLRALISYFSLPIIYIASYNYFLRYGFPFKLVFFVNYLWITAAIVELFIPEFGGLISENRTTSNRGVTSLAPEPTYFGVFLFIISMLVFVASDFKFNPKIAVFFLLNFIASIFLAKSAMVAIFYLLSAVFLIFYFIISRYWNKKFVASLAVVSIFFPIFAMLLFQYLDGSRLLYIFMNLTERPLSELIHMDASINQRFESIYFSVFGALNNFLLPGGLDTFSSTRDNILESIGSFFWNLSSSNKIMSWNGSIFYELGFFGFLSVSLFFGASYNGSRKNLYFLIFTFVILWSAIPVAFPLIPIMFALFAFKKFTRRFKSAQSYQVSNVGI